MSSNNNNLTKKQWDMVQNVMNQISLDEVNDKIQQEENSDLKKMKQMVAQTYKEQYGKDLAPEKLNQYFNVFQNIKVKLKHNKKAEPVFSRKEKIQLYFRAKFYRHEPTEEDILKYYPRSDAEIKEQVEYILNLNRKPYFISVLTLFAFNIANLIYLINSDTYRSIKILVFFLGTLLLFNCAINLKNLLKNLKKMKEGLHKLEQKEYDSLECKTMFALISPLDERGVLGRYSSHLPNLNILSESSIHIDSRYLNQRQQTILKVWQKSNKVIRGYDIQLLKEI